MLFLNVINYLTWFIRWERGSRSAQTAWQSLWGVGTRWPWTSSGSWAQPLPDTLARMRGKKLTRDIPDQQQEPAPGRLSIKRWRRGTLQAASVSQNHQISTVLKKAGRRV